MCKEIDVGRVFHSYANEQRSQKPEKKQVRAGRFVPEATDDARLLPRVREAVRR